MAGPPATFASLLRARRGYLGTHSPDGVAEVVPVCFTWAGEVIWIAVEAGDQSVESILADADRDDGGRACFLVDRWDEDWRRLAWVRAYGTAELLEPQPREREEHGAAVTALKQKYPQYVDHDLNGRPIIRVSLTRAVSWGAIG